MKKYKMTVTETSVVLTTELSAQNETEAKAALREMKERGRLFWTEPVDILAEEVIEEIVLPEVKESRTDGIPDSACKGRDPEWILFKTNQMLSVRPDDIAFYLIPFESTDKYREDMTDMSYVEEFVNYIKGQIYGDHNEGDWNIQGIADCVMREMRDDDAWDTDELDFYIRTYVYEPVKSRKREDADSVASAVRKIVENRICEE